MYSHDADETKSYRDLRMDGVNEQNMYYELLQIIILIKVFIILTEI